MENLIWKNQFSNVVIFDVIRTDYESSSKMRNNIHKRKEAIEKSVDFPTPPFW